MLIQHLVGGYVSREKEGKSSDTRKLVLSPCAYGTVLMWSS